MPVTISGNGSVTGLTDWEATSVTHPDSVDTNITLADDGSVVFDSVPAAIQSAIDAVPVLAGIGSNVVQAIRTANFTTSSNTAVVLTDLDVTITPTSATSRILVTMIAPEVLNQNSGGGTIIKLQRDTVDVYGRGGYFGGGAFFDGSIAISFIDEPATTSAVNYRTMVNRSGGVGTAQVSRATLIAIEVAA